MRSSRVAPNSGSVGKVPRKNLHKNLIKCFDKNWRQQGYFPEKFPSVQVTIVESFFLNRELLATGSFMFKIIKTVNLCANYVQKIMNKGSRKMSVEMALISFYYPGFSSVSFWTPFPTLKAENQNFSRGGVCSKEDIGNKWVKFEYSHKINLFSIFLTVHMQLIATGNVK